jgi:TolB-like protein
VGPGVADIFISYAREDAKWVARLATALEKAGYSVWLDRHLVTGARYLRETEAQLRAAKTTIVVWSKTSVESHWVADEATLARDLGRLAPISMDGTMPPLGFGQYQATEFSGWRAGRDEPLQTLLRALAEKTGQAPDLAAPSARPTIKRIPPIAMAGGALVVLLFTLLLGWSTGSFRSGGSAGDASVAVLPFVDHSEGGDQLHLASGMAVEVLSRLRGIEKLKVAGGDWMPEMVKDAGGDPKALGQRLSVTHILEGDVRTEGDKLRIAARLTQVGDSRIVWSQVYEREKSGVFAIQDDIALKVANALSVALNVGLQSASYGGTNNFEAYDHYLRGRALLNRGPPQPMVQELEQAVAIDPNYARAWAQLAIAYGAVARLATTPAAMKPALEKMDRASARAETLAPKTWFGHACRGWYYLALNDWLEADAAHNRALAQGELADPELYFMMQAFEGQVGRASYSKQMLDKFLALDPWNPQGREFRLANAILLGQYKSAWEMYEATQSSADSSSREYNALWLALADGKSERAREIVKDLSTNPLYPELAAMIASPRQALEQVRAIAEEPAPGRPRASEAALIAGQLGDKDLAVKLLRKAYLGPGWAGYYAVWFPQLAKARKTQAFKDFARDVGFVEMWRKSGDWGDFCRPLAGNDFECR